MHRVIHEFLDLQDGSYHYHVGDTFPRKGKRAAAARIMELSGNGNKIGLPLIEEIKEDKPKARATTRKSK